MSDQTYTVLGRCSNCDYGGPLTFPKGVESSGEVVCPNCGCKTASRRRKLAIDVRDVPKTWIPSVPMGVSQWSDPLDRKQRWGTP